MSQPITEEQVRDIYRETIEPLYRFVSRRCGGDRELAEDITQETWIRAVRVWRLEGIPQQPIAWLTTVSRNLLLNQLRRRPHLSLDHVAAERALAAVEADCLSDSAEVAAAVNRALDRLPSNQSRLLEAFHYDHRRVAEIADAYGISERAVEGRLRRARENLRRLLESGFHREGEIR